MEAVETKEAGSELDLREGGRLAGCKENSSVVSLEEPRRTWTVSKEAVLYVKGVNVRSIAIYE